MNPGLVDSLREIDAALPAFFPAFVFLFGTLIGSFLNVCIYRIPAERSVVSPRSSCACGRLIAWYDNIPILSWLLLRGRARCCGRPFSIRYPAIELLTGILFLLTWRAYPPVTSVAGMLFVSILICATFIDLDHMIIPDRFTIGGAVVGVVVAFLLPIASAFVASRGLDAALLDSIRSVLWAIVGALIGSAVVLWIGLLGEVVLRKEAMGFGDVKFLGAIGAFLGWQGAVFSIFGGAVLGTVALGGLMLVHRLRGTPAEAQSEAPAVVTEVPPASPEATSASAEATSASSATTEDAPIGFGQETPFGPMLAAGALVYFLFARAPVDAYFDSIRELLFN